MGKKRKQAMSSAEAQVAHVMGTGKQVEGGMTAQATGPLDAPAQHWAQAQHPGFQGLVSLG